MIDGMLDRTDALVEIARGLPAQIASFGLRRESAVIVGVLLLSKTTVNLPPETVTSRLSRVSKTGGKPWLLSTSSHDAV